MLWAAAPWCFDLCVVWDRANLNALVLWSRQQSLMRALLTTIARPSTSCLLSVWSASCSCSSSSIWARVKLNKQSSCVRRKKLVARLNSHLACHPAMRCPEYGRVTHLTSPSRKSAHIGLSQCTVLFVSEMTPVRAELCVALIGYPSGRGVLCAILQPT